MRKLIVVLILTISLKSYSQFHEFSVGTGFSYYYGDLNIRNFDYTGPLALVLDNFDFRNYKASYSVSYRLNFKQRFSIGLNFYHLYLSGYDSDNGANSTGNDLIRYQRNLSFFSTVNQGFVDLKFEPWRVNNRWNKTTKWHFSPFVSLGFGIFGFNPKTIYQGKEIELQPLSTEGQSLGNNTSRYNLTQICLPVGAGIRFTPPSRRFSVSLDFQYSYTFTDYIDDVSTVYPDKNLFSTYNPVNAMIAQDLAYGHRPNFYAAGERRGDSKQNDHWLTGQIKFSYFIKEKSGCCNAEDNKKRKFWDFTR